MSESKLISPLLDNFAMGEPVSDHDGVQCRPAMEQDSKRKYIVKIISIPATQRNLHALLLAGAFKDRTAALDYFHELADGVVKETEILKQLSDLGGFLPYAGCQVVPMEEDTGYHVYLLSEYRASLERHFYREPMTHLQAVNLGLDVCASLAVCRRCGYLYVDLKPGNIYIGEDNSYRIGDLGFVPLDSLQYASLPDKYRSSYTAPEITDAYSALNETLDIYSAGLILYQAYNNGVLPQIDSEPGQPLPPPMYADYEMAEIILKACAPDPADRWHDPIQMGKALVSYMQRNSVNDTPIVPAPVTESKPRNEVSGVEPEDADAAFELYDTPLDVESEEVEAELEIEAEKSEDDEAILPPSNEEVTEVDTPADEPASAESADHEAATEDETVPDEAILSELDDTQLTDEVSAMLALADELIAHEPPEPVVAPEPVEIVLPTPEPEVAFEEPEAADAQPQETEAVLPEKVEEPALEEVIVQNEASELSEEDDDYEVPQKAPRSYKGLIIFLLVIAIGLSIFTGGYAFYKFYYLQHIHGMSVHGDNELVTVTVNTGVDNSLLTVVCKDTYGNTVRRPLENGRAVFSSLTPGTSYKFQLEISGMHALTGQTEAAYTTAEQTSILNLSAVAGSEDGSVIISFTVQGPDSSWQIVCSAEGEPEKTFPCTDHTATIQGLIPGKQYTFRLVPANDLYITGETSVSYTASKVFFAQDLMVSTFIDNALTATWSAPAGATVESWTVRCYNTSGFDKTINVTDTTAVFENLDPSSAYNIEVTAFGMTRSVTVSISANTVTVYNVQITQSSKTELTASWEFSGNTPAGGWRVLYYIDGGNEPLILTTDTNQAVLPLVPGSRYTVTILQANGDTVLGGSGEYQTPQAEPFSGYWLTAESLDFRTCLPTEDPYPTQDTVTFASTFAPGDKISVLMHTANIYQNGFEKIVNLYVVRNAQGAVVSFMNPVRLWADMLEGGFGIINLPAAPSTPGVYTVEVFFDSTYAGTVTFSVA